MEEKLVYFETPGRDNTEVAVRLVVEQAKASGISTIVLASTGGHTTRRAAELWAGTGIKLVVVRDS